MQRTWTFALNNTHHSKIGATPLALVQLVIGTKVIEAAPNHR